MKSKLLYAILGVGMACLATQEKSVAVPTLFVSMAVFSYITARIPQRDTTIKKLLAMTVGALKGFCVALVVGGTTYGIVVAIITEPLPRSLIVSPFKSWAGWILHFTFGLSREAIQNADVTEIALYLLIIVTLMSLVERYLSTHSHFLRCSKKLW